MTIGFWHYAVLILATMMMGAMAGAFQLYAHAIMPGLGRVNDHVFVSAFQQTDRAIINPFFMALFVGALVLTGIAATLFFWAGARPIALWISAAFVLYLITFVITIAVNVPLNNAIKAAGDPDTIENLGAVRAAFDEARWVRFNWIRAVLSTGAFGCLAWSLVLLGRLA